jgi:hypothetical protein
MDLGNVAMVGSAVRMLAAARGLQVASRGLKLLLLLLLLSQSAGLAPRAAAVCL